MKKTRLLIALPLIPIVSSQLFLFFTNKGVLEYLGLNSQLSKAVDAIFSVLGWAIIWILVGTFVPRENK